ncbi:MAG: hypothetical protein KGY68_04245 [Candidatus Thermoplasmatota archaeon]|nr:hypothetical protein [Candidatus Thermoplasmatota archaeon]
MIDKVREPGEKPESDLYSMDKFVCDLCQGVREREGITQCGFCGRWVCKGENSCWDDELKCCESCSGLIILAKSGDLLEEEIDENEVEKDE